MVCKPGLPALAALTALPAFAQTPEAAKGLQVLWIAKAGAEISNTVPGFEFLHPATQAEVRLVRGKDFKPFLESLPALMKSNGIWISTSNSFLYSDEENAELRALVQLARTQKIHVFICQIMDQPEGWKKLDE
jgi:hypothetical protein